MAKRGNLYTKLAEIVPTGGGFDLQFVPLRSELGGQYPLPTIMSLRHNEGLTCSVCQKHGATNWNWVGLQQKATL